MVSTVCFSSKRTRAFSVARLTLACTPSSRLRFFSMRTAHAAHVIPSTSSSTCSIALLHEQHGSRREVEDLGRGRAEQRARGCRQAARADVDQVAARALRVLDQRLGDRADEDLRLVANARGVEPLL